MVVDAYGYPIYFNLSEGQEADSAYANEVLTHVDTAGCDVLADKGYDSDKIIDFIYEYGREPTIPPKANRTVQHRTDWRIYKERHQVECFFQKLKNFRRIATRYDKLACTLRFYNKYLQKLIKYSCWMNSKQTTRRLAHSPLSVDVAILTPFFLFCLKVQTLQ